MPTIKRRGRAAEDAGTATAVMDAPPGGPPDDPMTPDEDGGGGEDAFDFDDLPPMPDRDPDRMAEWAEGEYQRLVRQAASGGPADGPTIASTASMTGRSASQAQGDIAGYRRRLEAATLLEAFDGDDAPAKEARLKALADEADRAGRDLIDLRKRHEAERRDAENRAAAAGVASSLAASSARAERQGLIDALLATADPALTDAAGAAERERRDAIDLLNRQGVRLVAPSAVESATRKRDAAERRIEELGRARLDIDAFDWSKPAKG